MANKTKADLLAEIKTLKGQIKDAETVIEDLKSVPPEQGETASLPVKAPDPTTGPCFGNLVFDPIRESQFEDVKKAYNLLKNVGLEFKQRVVSLPSPQGLRYRVTWQFNHELKGAVLYLIKLLK